MGPDSNCQSVRPPLRRADRHTHTCARRSHRRRAIRVDLTRTGPYYADRTSDIEKTIRSLERLKEIPAETYLTAHGKGVREGDPAYIDRYLRIIHEREERLLDFLQKGPRNLTEIAAEGLIYGKDPSSMGEWDLTLSERMTIGKHMDRLMGEGRVRRDGDLYHCIE